MFSWFKKILQRRGVSFLPVLQVPLAPEWQSDDAAALRKFLSSKSGQKLLMRARAMEAFYAIHACSDAHMHPKTVGGITFTLNWIEKLVTLPGESAVQDSESDYSTRQNADASLPEFATT